MKSILPALLSLAFLLAPGTPARALEKWLYVKKNLQVDASVGELDALMKRGAAAGYTHLLLADSKLARLGTLGDIYPRYERNTRQVQESAKRHGIEIVPALFHIGYSNAMLFHDPNLVEAMPAKNVPLVVKDGVARVADQKVSLPGGDFSDLKKWSWKDDNITVENGAARFQPDGKNGRIVQNLTVEPWRQYHVSVRIKTQDLRGAMPEIKALTGKGNTSLTWSNLGVKPTQDWTTHHAIFNSRENTTVSLFFGTWGSKSGTLWWDDAKIEEVAFVNLARRPGCPLVIATADGKPLVEGRDFERLEDELLGAKPWRGEYDVYHTPPVLKTSLPDGTRLLASYHHAMTVYDGQAMVCLSEPKTMELLRDEARRVHALWQAKGYMMSHDECRMMNWCAACEKRGKTPGQMLAENVKACAAILREVNPGGRIHVWNDMFDPNHNAGTGPYYLVNGPIAGSWEGLDKDVIIVPWYFEKRAESLKFFADRGHRQVIAGYYDAPPERVKKWLEAAREVPGSVIGVMYTTWQGKYSDIEAFSRAMDGENRR